MERDAALRKRERLIVAVAHQRHVGLVVHDAGEDIVCGNGHGEPLALSKSRRRFVDTSRLRQQHGGERVHEREMTPIAGRVQRGRRFGEVIADDTRVPDLVVAERQLVVGEADGAGLVGELGVLQGARVERNGPGLLALGIRKPAVQTPQRRELAVRDALLKGVGRPSKRRGSLNQVVLQQPGLSQGGADGQFVFAIERTGSQQRDQVWRGVGPASPLQGRVRARERRVQAGCRHVRSIQSIQPRGSYNTCPMPLAAHGATHPGRRITNEDAFLVDLNRGLFIVADGMGGHNAGEVASDLAIKTIGEFLTNGTLPSPDTMKKALRRANDHILAVATEEPDYLGMGTTVVAALLTDRGMVYAHVGDSRAYLWRDGEFVQLTRDDTWVAAALNGAVEDAREIEQHPMRHVLTKVVGLRPDLQPSAAEITFGTGDALLLCSDGVHGALPEETLAALIGAGSPVETLAERVVQQAIDHGATDNVTAIVVRRE